MRIQYENLLLSNFIFFVDHNLSTEGEAYANHGSNFYPLTQQYENIHSYSAPFKQFVCDESISGSTNPDVLSGVYLNNNYISPGEGGLVSINPYQGQLYFNTQVTGTISGNYSVKDFNIYLTNEAEEDLLFETHFELNPRTEQVPTGIPTDHKTYPAIFLKDIGGKNIPHSYGGTDLTRTTIRAIVLARSSYELDAVCSIFRDFKGKDIPLIPEKDMPFNSMGAYTGGFNYLNSVSGIEDTSYIDEVFVSRIPSVEEIFLI